MPIPALPQGREESSKERMENKGHLQTPLAQIYGSHGPSTALCQSVDVALNKHKSLPPKQMWAEVWPKRKIRSSESRLALSERKPNTMQPVHSIFFITVLRAAIQCFPIKNTAIYHRETGVSRKHFHYLCYGKEVTKRRAKRWQTIFMRLDFRPSQGWPALLFHTRKKVIGFSYVGLIQQEGAATLWRLRTNQNEWKYLYSVRSSGCVNQGAFVSFLAGWCWLTVGSAGLSIQLVEQRQSQSPAVLWRGDIGEQEPMVLPGNYLVCIRKAGFKVVAPNTEEFINKRAQMGKIWKVWEDNRGKNKQITLKWSKEALKMAEG